MSMLQEHACNQVTMLQQLGLVGVGMLWDAPLSQSRTYVDTRSACTSCEKRPGLPKRAGADAAAQLVASLTQDLRDLDFEL